MINIKIGDMVYDCESGKNLIGWVVGKQYPKWWIVQWNDGSRIQIPSHIVRDLKKEWHKLRKKCLTGKRK